MKWVLLLLVLSSPVLAHHSRANFDRTSKLELSGTLVDYAWRNPHVYLELQVKDAQGREQTWLVEAHSVTGMKNQGWSKDTFAVGEQVTITGQPDRNPDKLFLLLDSIEKQDGTTLRAFGRRGNQESQKIAASADFSGTWGIDMSRFNTRTAGGGPPEDWSYTEKGKQQASSFSVNDNPELNCHQIGVPKITIYPYGINWFRDENVIRVEKEHLDEQRVIYLDPNDPRINDAVASYSGTSVGRFESARHLVVETTNFLPTPWGNANGIDSSAKKKVIEDYQLAEDGMSVEVTITIEDPEYLTAPGKVSGGYIKAPNRDFEKLGCDPAAASRHLTVE